MIDRIVATVGKRAVLQSELDQAVRYELFTAGRQIDTLTIADVKASLARIVDQQLLRADMGPTEAFAPAEEDLAKGVAEVRTQTVGAGSDQAWRDALRTYGLTEAIVRDRVRSQLETLRIVNSRLRPGVRVDQTEVETAYRQEFLPKLRQAGAKEPPLAEVSQRIRQILVERHMGENLDKWLEALRSQADIHIVVDELQPDENRSAAENGKGSEPQSR